MDWLVFIDTNILLDFYRVEGKQQEGLSVLDHLEGNYERFIATNQVEIEFKKNRQKIILGAFGPIAKLADAMKSKNTIPAFLEGSPSAGSLLKAEKKARKSIAVLRERVGRIIEDPAHHDAVYKKVQQLFSAETRHNLRNGTDQWREVLDSARQRFEHGAPPRKDKDTSFGDAINWEWILRCAKESRCNVAIVSRDSDFGEVFGEQHILNTWLRQEFHVRTSTQHQIHLTNKLTYALKKAGISTTAREQQQEDEFLEKHRAKGTLAAAMLEHSLKTAFGPTHFAELSDVILAAAKAGEPELKQLAELMGIIEELAPSTDNAEDH